jgi:hypothetical protein
MALKNVKTFGSVVAVALFATGCASYTTGVETAGSGEYRISGYDKTVFSGDVVKGELFTWAERFCGTQIEKRQSMKAVLTQTRVLDYRPGEPASAELTFKCVAPKQAST